MVIPNTNPFFNEFDGAGFNADAEKNFDIFKINLIINSEPIDYSEIGYNFLKLKKAIFGGVT